MAMTNTTSHRPGLTFCLRSAPHITFGLFLWRKACVSREIENAHGNGVIMKESQGGTRD